MAGATSHNVPRLPPRAEPQQLEFALLAPNLDPASRLDTDWPAFEEPALLSLKGPRRLVLAARAIALVWAATVVVVAMRSRERVIAGTDVGGEIDRVARIGIAIVVTIAITGWFWSDRATRNVHRLGGRLPTRARCVSAWSLPLVWAALLAVTVVRFDPTEP